MKKDTPPVFNEKDARRFYRWLDHHHDEYTEIRIISWPPTGLVIQRWVQNEDDFIQLCRKWSGKRQVYAGVNPRIREGGSAEDVSRIVAVPFDIDSEHPTKEAATDEEVEQAKQRMIELVSWIRIEGYKAPLVAMSGNGYHALQRVDLDIDDTLASRLEAYFHEAPIEGRTDSEKQLDNILDHPRIIKVPGTMSVKGVPTEERPHRLSYILDEGDPGVDLLLAQKIVELEPYEASITTTAAAVATTEKGKKRKTRGLLPCFKRFAEEGGRLATIGSEDNLLRLALVAEAHAKGYSRAQIIELFTKANDFDPKMTRDKVDYQLGKLAVEGKKVWSCLAIYKHNGCCFGEVCKYYAKRVKKHLDKKFSTPLVNDESPPEDAFFDEDGNFVPRALGDTLLGNDRFAATGDKSKIWIYNPDNGVWEDNGIEKIQEYSTQLLGNRFRNSHVTEVVKYIRYVRYIDPALLGSSQHTIVVKNGVININTSELTPFDPDLYEISCIPVRFDPAAKSPKIKKFLDEVLLPGWADTIYELVGYTLLKSYPIARIFIFNGEGRNGKTQLIVIIKKFLGGKNVSSLTLQQISQTTFAPAQLHGKLANLCADIPPTPIKYTGLIKILTGGGDTLTVQKKYFALFDMVNYAKLIFSANEVPPAHDKTPAWLRRPILVDFPNIFPAGDPGTIMDIGEKISTDEELSGLLNLALTGLQRLLKQGKFTNEAALEQRSEEYIRKSNPVQYFITQFVEEAPSLLEKLEKGILYKSYVTLCHALGRRPLASNKFSAEIPRYLPYIDDGDYDKVVGKTKAGKPRTRKTRIWYGIRLKKEALKKEIEELKKKHSHRYDSLYLRKIGELPNNKKEGKEEGTRGRDRSNRSDNDENYTGKSPRDLALAPEPLKDDDDTRAIERLVEAAIAILEENDGRMKQKDLFQALIDAGYHYVNANTVLRGDKRFIFMGMEVRLGKQPKEVD